MINPQAEALRVCLVVPCYNEAARLNTSAFQEYFAHAQADGIRVLFVDDGSKDNTVAVLKKLCEGFEGCAGYLESKPNAGKAEAVRKGIVYATEHYDVTVVGYWDADLATPLSAIDGFVGILKARPSIEMVFGARIQLLGRHVHRKPIRHYLGRVFATVASVTLSLAIYDTQCGAKLFRVNDELKRVFADRFLSKWVFDVEILARYSQLCGHDRGQMERSIYEYPLERWEDVAGSKVKPRDFLTAMRDLYRIRRRYLVGGAGK